ncbi:MAG TPA: M14 family metallopeptidase [Leptolinea sp.]
MAEITTEITELLAQAIRAIQYGHKSAAAGYLNRILEQDPENMDAWRWLSECMPNQSKRDYCLEQAGLSALSNQSHRAAIRLPGASISQSFMTEAITGEAEPTLAEKHAKKSILRRQRRAELPPQFHPIPPKIDFDIPKTTLPARRTLSANRLPQNQKPASGRRPVKQSRRKISLGGLSLSALVIAATVVAGFVLFSTGLTTGKHVFDWVITQIDNNMAYLPVIGSLTSPTPQSLFDQPAEAPAVLSTYFPTQVATPDPSQGIPAADNVPLESDARESAEIPAGDQVTEITTDVSSDTSADATVDTSTNTTADTPAEPSGFVAGPTVIGKSVKGNNLEVMQFGNGPIERMIVAGIHGGNEWNTTALADQLITYLKKNPQVIPADRTLYILRLLNPDGEARGHNLDGRTNERGVDLNRNWDAYWEVDWPRDGCWNYRPISAGSSAFSEPETQALRDFLKAHNISALINYHSAALGVFAGGRPPETESVRLAKSIAAVSNYAYPPTDTGCKYTGQFADWLAMNGTAAVDLELTNHTDTDYDVNLKVLDVLLKWEPSTGPKSLTGLINLAQSTTVKPTLADQVGQFGSRTWNEINNLIFGRQEEK